MFLLFYRSSLESCPQEVLVHIFSYLDLFLLLTSVSRVCTKFSWLIKTAPVLWKFLTFPHQIQVSKDSIKLILKHSRFIVDLTIGCALYSSTTPDVDFEFTRATFTNLSCLDISESLVSTLCFLKTAPALTILDVSGCKHLIDEDFDAINNCNLLEQLYVSFTNISADTLESVCCLKPLLVVDACNVNLTLRHCRNIILHTRGELKKFHFSLHQDVSFDNYRREISECFVNTSLVVHEHNYE